MKYFFFFSAIIVFVTSCVAQDERGMKLNDTTSQVQPVLKSNVERLGKDYAVLFATDQYDEWPPLVNPVNDAQSIAKELSDYYGFHVEVIQNPTKLQMLTKLREFATRSYGPNDQLMVFFAGHGDFDEIEKEGFVVAKDTKLRANDEVRSTFVPHSTIRNYVDNIPCNHTLLMMDVCFGGTFDRQIAMADRGGADYSEISNAEFIQRTMEFKTRKYITSGGKDYVSDGVPGAHSPFVRRILEALRTYGGKEGFVDIPKIITYLARLDPQPRYGDISTLNQPGSDFFFVPKTKRATSVLSVKASVPTAQVFLDNIPVGTGRYAGEVEVGRHSVRVYNDGYRTWEQVVEVGASPASVAANLEAMTGALTVTTMPADAEIYIDSAYVGKGSYTGTVPVGRRLIKAMKTGFKSAERVVLLADKTISTQIVLEPIRAQLTITTNPPGATVEIDGAKLGSTPLKVQDVSFGKRTVRVSLNNYVPQELAVDVSSDAPITQNLNLRETPDFRARKIFASELATNRTWSWTTLVLTAGSAGGAYYLQTQADNAYNLYLGETNQALVDKKWNDYRQQILYRNVAFGVAGAFAVWTIYEWLSTPNYDDILKDVKQENASISVAPVGHGVQLLMSYQF